MENAINSLRIQHFKSIKDVTLQPRRVNLIIGQPNVGKSNVLEAISLLGGMFFDNELPFMTGQIRYENLHNVFYDNDWSQHIKVKSNVGVAFIVKAAHIIQIAYANYEASLLNPKPNSVENIIQLTEKFKKDDGAGIFDKIMDESPNNYKSANAFFGTYTVEGEHFLSSQIMLNEQVPVKKYSFDKRADCKNVYGETFLRPPFGDNLLDVLQHNGALLRREIANLFRPYGLDFVMRVNERKFEIQKNEDGFITAIPYSLIADTLQRIIFYMAAIESNTNSVLLFEEPEAHSYPEYVTRLARRMVDSRTNQFFVATHSPYLFTEIVEQMLPDDEQAGDLAIFVAYYEDYQTKIHQLTDEQMRNIRRDSVDVFLNMRRFIPRSADV